MDVGDSLRRAREQAGLSQRELSRSAAVPASTVGRIERGQMSPTIQMLARLAVAMDIHLSVTFAPSLLDLVRVHASQIEGLCARHGASHPRVFGSVARGDEDAASDIDLLVDLHGSADLFSLVRLERDLRDLLGVDVDVVPCTALDNDVRELVEREAVPV